MSRLIDADKLWKAFTSADKDDIFGIEDIEQIVDDAPTIDAVEVVRCDDCKYRYMDADLQVWTCTYGLMIKPNGFCNYGERKGE